MRPHIYLPLLAHYYFEPRFVECLLALVMTLPRRGYNLTIRVHAGESLITRARNRVTKEFLETDCTHILFVDADETFEPEDVMGMVESGHALVGATVPKKGINWERVRERAAAGTPAEELQAAASDVVVNVTAGQKVLVDGCVPVDAIGTGFMLIERKVFDAIRAEFGEDIACHVGNDMTEVTHAYFDCAIHPEDRRYLSEDYTFCWRAKAVGIQPHADLRPRIGHMGSYEFKGTPLTIFSFPPETCRPYRQQLEEHERAAVPDPPR